MSSEKITEAEINDFADRCVRAGIPLLLAVHVSQGDTILRANGSVEQVASLKVFTEIYVHRCIVNVGMVNPLNDIENPMPGRFN